MKHKIRYIGILIGTKAYMMVHNDILYILYSYNYTNNTFKIVLFEDFAENDLKNIQIFSIKNNIISPSYFDVDIFITIKKKNAMVRRVKLLYIDKYV